MNDLPHSEALAVADPHSEALAVAEGRPTLADVQAWPATVRVPQAALALGCSRSELYEEIKLGTAPVRTLEFGRRRVVITADLIRVLSADPAEGQPAA